jgi:hypothetical protein
VRRRFMERIKHATKGLRKQSLLTSKTAISIKGKSSLVPWRQKSLCQIDTVGTSVAEIAERERIGYRLRRLLRLASQE